MKTRDGVTDNSLHITKDGVHISEITENVYTIQKGHVILCNSYSFDIGEWSWQHDFEMGEDVGSGSVCTADTYSTISVAKYALILEIKRDQFKRQETYSAGDGRYDG